MLCGARYPANELLNKNDRGPTLPLIYEVKLMIFNSKSVLQTVSVALSVLIAFLPAQAQTLPTALNLTVIEGEGAVNNIRQRLARDPIVQVEDENHKPVAGAIVVFTLPTEGATGDFNGHKTLTVTTDSGGQATGKGLKMNPVPGRVPIHVTVSYRGLSARTIINQVSVVPPGAKAGAEKSGGHGALIGVLVALGAAAAGGGAYLATHQNKQSSTPPVTPAGPTPIGITPGTGSITGGH
jgi:hypothetical protein